MENFYLVEKTKQRKFREKNRRFVYSGIVKTCDELDLIEENTSSAIAPALPYVSISPFDARVIIAPIRPFMNKNRKLITNEFFR